MKKRVGLLAGIALSLALGSPVLAAQPANHACGGETVSGAAHQGKYGQLVVAPVAKDDRGVGAEVQLILAGDFPDEFFPNTCND
jgi:hypothetical protein